MIFSLKKYFKILFISGAGRIWEKNIFPATQQSESCAKRWDLSGKTMPEARTSMATVTKALMAAPVVTRVMILRLTTLFCGPPPGWLETIALHSMEAIALRMPWTVLLAELLELEGSPRDPVRKDWPIRCVKWSRLKRRLSRPFRKTIGNVQLFSY